MGPIQHILDSAMDAIITINDYQNIVYFNPAAVEMFGYTLEQILNTSLDQLIPDRYRSKHTEHVDRFGETGITSRRMGKLSIIAGLRQNGEEFPIEASISQATNELGEKFYTVILRDITERIRIENELRSSKEELQHIGCKINTAREQEKNRIARELHDELGQALTALKLDVQWLKEQLLKTDASHKKLCGMEELINTTVTVMRRISTELRPLILDDLGLLSAIDWLSQSFTQNTGIICKWSTNDPELELHDPYATAIFRIVQESFTNIAKHAHASQVNVYIEKTNTKVDVKVQDNGVGFSLQAPHKPHSYGLIGIYERAYFLGGTAIIESTPGNGTCVKASIPLTTIP